MRCGAMSIIMLISRFSRVTGREYMGKVFIRHLKAAGTMQRLTVHDTPQQNSVAE